jgi:probable phosphoglycerate mutase
MNRAGKMPPPEGARLFSDGDPKIPTSGVHIAYIDGASRGNPGPAAYAVVVRDPAGHVVLELAKRLGRDTNNVAEYYALLAALDYATSRGISALRIRSDSELLVRQMHGRYKVKSADLKPLYERALKLVRQLAYFAIEHVPREHNRDADALANVALDSGNVSSATPDVAKQPSPGVLETTPPRSVLRRVRARFASGVFTPAAPVDIAEGSDVVLDIEFLPRK